MVNIYQSITKHLGPMALVVGFEPMVHWTKPVDIVMKSYKDTHNPLK